MLLADDDVVQTTYRDVEDPHRIFNSIGRDLRCHLAVCDSVSNVRLTHARAGESNSGSTQAVVDAICPLSPLHNEVGVTVE